MKFGHHSARAGHASLSVLGSLCLVWSLSACGASESDPQQPVDELEQGLRGALVRSAGRGGPGHGVWGGRGRRHHAGPGGQHGGGNGGSGGGGPVVEPCGPFDPDNLYQTVNADLARQDADDQPFQRYLTVANRAAALGCGAALDGERAALNKLLNSLSINASLEPPTAIDADLTVFRLDLRNYDWDRPVTVGGEQFDDAWEALIAASPYAVEYVGDDADDAKSDTGTSVPVLFANAFVAATARAPLYYGLLDIPTDADDFLLDSLAIDVAAARADGESVRAGFVANGQGGASEFLAERFDIEVRAGYVWQVAEFSDDLGDLFDDPLGNASGERGLAFTLPNGLLGHVLADGNGQVRATSNVLIDALEADSRASIATSFFRSRANGVELTDQVRAFVLANPGNFSAAERAAILAAYPADEQLQQILGDDRDGFFARGLQLIGLDIADSPEPISQAFANFGANVDAETAAGDLLVTTEDLLDNLGLLDPAFAVLANGGTLSRADFTELYVDAGCILGAVLENQFDPNLCF